MALRTAGESEFCQGVALRCETGKYGAVRANAGIQATLDMGMSAADVGAALDVRRLELPPPWRHDQHAFRPLTGTAYSEYSIVCSSCRGRATSLRQPSGYAM